MSNCSFEPVSNCSIVHFWPGSGVKHWAKNWNPCDPIGHPYIFDAIEGTSAFVITRCVLSNLQSFSGIHPCNPCTISNPGPVEHVITASVLR